MREKPIKYSKQDFCRDFPGRSEVKTSTLPTQAVWVRSLARELRSHMPESVDKKIIRKKTSSCKETPGTDNSQQFVALVQLPSHVQLFATPWSSSSVHGIPQARTLEWVAISFSRGSSQPRDRTCVSCLAGGFFYH